jgi:hypothetical protein
MELTTDGEFNQPSFSMMGCLINIERSTFNLFTVPAM